MLLFIEGWAREMIALHTARGPQCLCSICWARGDDECIIRTNVRTLQCWRLAQQHITLNCQYLCRYCAVPDMHFVFIFFFYFAAHIYSKQPVINRDCMYLFIFFAQWFRGAKRLSQFIIQMVVLYLFEKLLCVHEQSMGIHSSEHYPIFLLIVFFRIIIRRLTAKFFFFFSARKQNEKGTPNVMPKNEQWA